jgi:hypothetical protein
LAVSHPVAVLVLGFQKRLQKIVRLDTSLDPAWKLHSMDGVHAHISEAIKLDSQIHPSFAALKKGDK